MLKNITLYTDHSVCKRFFYYVIIINFIDRYLSTMLTMNYCFNIFIIIYYYSVYSIYEHYHISESYYFEKK